jgi:lipopolysaccharide export system permease protein
VCTLLLIPKGISEGRRLTYEAVTSHVGATIEERTIFDKFEDIVIYVEEVDPAGGILKHVYIRDSSMPDKIRTIIAKRGQVAPDPRKEALVMDLKQGTILTSNSQGESIGNVAFESSQFRFPLPRPDESLTQKSLEETSLSGIMMRVSEARAKEAVCPPEHRDYYRRTQQLGLTLVTQRFTHPLACMALALLAFPLGVVGLGSSRLNNVSVGLVAIFLYYALILATERIARSGLAPPQFVLPTAPLVCAGVGMYLTHCVRMERMPYVLRRLQYLLDRLRGGTG